VAKGAKTGGRQPGSLNKVTIEFRQTVQKVLEENASNVGKWLTMVAEGVPADGPNGKAVEPDPGKALDLMAKLAEFAAPKLARTEVTGKDGGPVVVSASPLDERL
jgi:hypothetical protein